MTGLTDTERQDELQDIHFMRIAVRLSTADLYPVTARLLGNANAAIERMERDFPELRFCDRAFVIMTEWKKLMEDRDVRPSAEKMVHAFGTMANTESNRHTVCMVCILNTGNVLFYIIDTNYKLAMHWWIRAPTLCFEKCPLPPICPKTYWSRQNVSVVMIAWLWDIWQIYLSPYIIKQDLCRFSDFSAISRLESGVKRISEIVAVRPGIEPRTTCSVS